MFELCLEVEKGRRKSLVSTVTYELVGHITTRPMIIFSIYQQQFFTRFLETELSIGAFRTPTRGSHSLKSQKNVSFEHFPQKWLDGVYESISRFSINEMPKITISLLLYYFMLYKYFTTLYYTSKRHLTNFLHASRKNEFILENQP